MFLFVLTNQTNLCCMLDELRSDKPNTREEEEKETELFSFSLLFRLFFCLFV